MGSGATGFTFEDLRASPEFPFIVDYKIDVEKVKGNWIEQ